MEQTLSLLGAGLVAGTMNALAGGGSFVTLSALIAAGVPSVGANASSTVALYPAGAASAWVYRGGLARDCGVPLGPTLAATLAGASRVRCCCSRRRTALSIAYCPGCCSPPP